MKFKKGQKVRLNPKSAHYERLRSRWWPQRILEIYDVDNSSYGQTVWIWSIVMNQAGALSDPTTYIIPISKSPNKL